MATTTIHQHTAPPTAPPTSMLDTEVVAFLAGRSVPCPRCAYDLRDAPTATCPECGEPLVLKIGSPRMRFGWLLLAMTPGAFSGVAATLLLVPVAITLGRTFAPGQGLPWPILAADIFGFASVAMAGVMYWRRHDVMSWRTRHQVLLAAGVWFVHILAFVLFVYAMSFW